MRMERVWLAYGKLNGILANFADNGGRETLDRGPPVTIRNAPKRRERSYTELLGDLTDLENWLRDDKLKARMIPADWRRIERDVPLRAKKTDLTARFDADVVKWFSGLGLGCRRG